MPRQAFVDEGVIGAEQVENARVVAQGIGDEHPGFALECLDQADVVFGEDNGIDHHLFEPSQIQPLRGKILDQGLYAAPVGEQPTRLLGVNVRIGKAPRFGQSQQFFVGSAAPEEIGQARGQFEVVQRMDAAIGLCRLFVTANEKLGVGKQIFEGELNA